MTQTTKVLDELEAHVSEYTPSDSYYREDLEMKELRGLKEFAKGRNPRQTKLRKKENDMPKGNILADALETAVAKNIAEGEKLAKRRELDFDNPYDDRKGNAEDLRNYAREHD